MKIKYHSVLFLLFTFFLIISCSKKHQPQTEAKAAVASTSEKEAKPLPARKEVKTPVPKVISVDDRAAKKAVDGRLYYDLEGHRYWKNYDDGKYYIFSSKMGGNPAFKPH